MWCGLFLKKSTQEGTWNRISGNFHRISRGIEERVCGNSGAIALSYPPIVIDDSS